MAYKFNSGSSQARDSGALSYGETTSDIADTSAAQRELDATPEQRAAELRIAIRDGDMRSIYLLLGGDNTALSGAFQRAYGTSVARYMIDTLPVHHLSAGVAFALYGKADARTRVLAVTRDIMGTDENKLYQIIEQASMEERFALANDGSVLFHLKNDLSGAALDRVLAPLRPLMGRNDLSAEARETLFGCIKASEARLGSQADTLITRLKARKGWFNDDEAGMLTDVKDWATGRGVGVPGLNPDKGEPGELAPLIDWLRSELSGPDFVKAMAMIRSGGEVGLMDKIDAAGEATTLWFSNTDEAAIYAAISHATPEQRQALLNDRTQLQRMLDLLDESEQKRALALLGHQGTTDSANALDQLIAELDSFFWVSDNTIFGCLERMSPSDLVRLRSDAGLVAQIEAGISDVPRFREMVGIGQQKADGSEATAQDLAASDGRLIARLEQATGHWDDDEDAVYKAVIEWQTAGGKMDSVQDSELIDRAWAAMSDLDAARRDEIMRALYGLRRLTSRDRLESAVVGWGTDDKGLESSLKEVSDLELVREWSTLDRFASLTEQQQADFIPDIDDDIKTMLKGDRDDWLELLGTLRDRLVVALRKPEVLAMARAEFGYTPRREMLARLQYAQSRQTLEHDRGDGFWNGISMGVMDSFSATGVHSEQKFGEYRGTMTEAVRQTEGSAQQNQTLDQAETARKDYLTAHKDYAQAKAAAAATAGALVGVIASVVVTVATMGAAGPACAALMGTVAGGALTELTDAAIQGNDYSPEKGAQDLGVALATGLITMGTGALAQKIASGASSMARVQALNQALTNKFGSTFAQGLSHVSKETLGTALSEFPLAYAEDLIRTEGLLRQEFGGVGGALEKAIRATGATLVSSAVSYKLNQHLGTEEALEQLKQTGQWDEYSDLLVRSKMVDLSIALTAEQLATGQMPTEDQLATMLRKLVTTAHGARLDASATMNDLGSTIEFFNSASADDLQKVTHIGPAIAADILAIRDANGGFTSLRQVLDVPRLRDDVLTPAAIQVRDNFHALKAQQRAQAETP